MCYETNLDKQSIMDKQSITGKQSIMGKQSITGKQSMMGKQSTMDVHLQVVHKGLRDCHSLYPQSPTFLHTHFAHSLHLFSARC